MFIELKCKSNFSFLRGASDARDYIIRARELNMSGVAITDLNGVYGVPRAYEVAKEFSDFNLITGSELKLSDHSNVTLLAKNRKGYGLLCSTITKLHAGKEKGEGQLTFHEFTKLFGADDRSQDLIALPDLDHANLGILKEIFSDNIYLPLCQYRDGLDEDRIEKTLKLSAQYGLRIFATNDVHYHVQTRKKLQDCLTCVREGVTLHSRSGHLFKNAERYLKSPFQMRILFKEFPQMLNATLEIAERCTFSVKELTYTYPVELIPEGHTDQSYLESLVLEGAHRIYRGHISAKVDEQIQREFKLIRELNYASYFLTIYDIVDFANRSKIICQGRGSAANSIVCYCLGVTAIDPVRMDLLFERFISAERNEPPDIDVDFEHDRREEVIQYIYQRYGRDRAAMVSAVRTYQHKSAFLELSKAFGVPVGTISANALSRDFDEIAGELKEKKLEIMEFAEDLVGFPRHLSIHSGGFTLSHHPIIETVPVEPARMPGRTIIQWDKNDLDTVGLLKLDILALGFLTALHKCADYVGIHWHEIPPEDLQTYDMICRAETEGCFQIESRAQKSMLPRTQPRTFYDLVVQVAIVRPGPNMGQMINPYMKRRDAEREGRPYVLPDPALIPALGRTYGVPIFQEQIMKVAILRGGFTPGEADQLRRAIAAWRSAEAVDVMAKKLYAGLIKGGASKEWADELFGYLKGYAHYGFPESHAASFAAIAYSSAYMKCHHPAELLCGLINSQPMGFYAIDTLINEAKRNGVRVLPIHPNVSGWEAKMEGEKTVRMGFQNVRRIREQDVRWMTAESERELNESDFNSGIGKEDLKGVYDVLEAERLKEPFHSLYDFVLRTKFSKDVIELMAMADVFDCFGQDQRHSYWSSIEFHNLIEKASKSQPSLFLEQPRNEKMVGLFEDLTFFEKISADYKALGYSTRGNIMAAVRKEIPSLPPLTTSIAKELKNKTEIVFAGVLTTIQRPPTAKGVAFLTLEDDEGSLDLIAKKEIFETYEEVIRNNRFLQIRGKIQRTKVIAPTGKHQKGVDHVQVILTDVKSFLVSPLAKSVTPGVTNRVFGPPV